MAKNSNTTKTNKNVKNGKVKLIFLGGVGEIGKNMTCLECGDSLIVIDAGLSFPSESMMGIDYVIPDYNYLLQNSHKLKGIVITHGHEDHIGALSVILKELNVPVYGSRLAIALVQHKLDEAKIKGAKLRTVVNGDQIDFGPFQVEFISMTHSTTGCFALSINSPVGTIFHTGDFKIDHTPVDKKTVDLARIAEIGSKGVHLLLMDSTNVERSGYSMSETKVFNSLDNIFSQNTTKRIIVATFASNIHRVQQIINCAIKHGRRVAYSGRSMENIAEIAYTIGELRYPPDTIVDIEKIGKIPEDKICIITTGTQGEPFSALTRMSQDNFKAVKIGENDTVIFSSSAIPGNEKLIYTVINNLYKRGAEVIYRTLEDIHVSGHACKEELRLMFALLKPKYFIPVHGEYRHLRQHIKLAKEMGIHEANTVLPEHGMVLYAAKNGLRKAEIMPLANIYVDGASLPEEAALMLKDRRHLACDGIVVAIVTTSSCESNAPIIISRGITIPEAMAEEMRQNILVEMNTGEFDASGLKQSIRKIVTKTIDKQLKKKPMVIPIVIET